MRGLLPGLTIVLLGLAVACGSSETAGTDPQSALSKTFEKMKSSGSYHIEGQSSSGQVWRTDEAAGDYLIQTDTHTATCDLVGAHGCGYQTHSL